MVKLPLAGQAPPAEATRSFNELSLSVKSYRQELLASNIANADTPDYKAVDIDFAEALRLAQLAAETTPLALTTTSTQHLLPTYSAWSLPPIPIKYQIPHQASIDGNTVETDVELAKFTENAIRYQFSLDRVSGRYKEMAALFASLK